MYREKEREDACCLIPDRVFSNVEPAGVILWVTAKETMVMSSGSAFSSISRQVVAYLHESI